jgi:hypothetical protein
VTLDHFVSIQLLGFFYQIVRMAAMVICLVNDSECDGNHNIKLMCLADRNKKLNKSQFPKARTDAQAIIYRADISDESKVDLSKTFICDRHFNLLFAQFNPKKHKWCYTCSSISGLSAPSTKDLRQINRKYALRIHAHFDLKHSYGEFICGTCRKGYDEFKQAYFSKRVARFVEWRQNQKRTTTDVQTIDEDYDDTKGSPNEEDSNADIDEDFLPGQDKESTKVLRDALDHLLDLCGNTNRTWVTEH